MLSREFEKLIYDYRALLFILMCLAGQIISWRMWLRLVRARLSRFLVHFGFIIFNLGWFFTVSTLYFGDNLTDFTWAIIGRPSVSWQLAHILVILPCAMLGSIFIGLIKKMRRRPALSHWGNASPQLGGANFAAGKGLLDDSYGVDENRRGFIKSVGLIGALGVLGGTAYGVVRQSRPPDVKRISLEIDQLPPELNNFKIAQITDIHLGLWASQKELARALELVGREHPHLVVFTGDQVDRSADYARLYHDPLKIISHVPCGVWGVLGNHDHYTGSPLTVAKILTDGGLEMLVDRQVNIPGFPLSIIGLDDQGMHHSWLGTGKPTIDKDDPDVLDFRVVRGPAPRAGDFTILLNHRPEGFAQAAKHGCRLYLAGHTHGGQYQMPGFDQVNLAAAFYKYSNGLYAGHNAWINVCPGLAAVGIPFRLGAWPQLDIITLRRKV